MDTIEGSFIIHIDGKPIAKAVDNGEDHIHAAVGTEGAVLRLQEGKLLSENGEWILSRFPIEDLSLLPKRVFWMKTNSRPNHVAHAEKNGDSYKLKIGGEF